MLKSEDQIILYGGSSYEPVDLVESDLESNEF